MRINLSAPCDAVFLLHLHIYNWINDPIKKSNHHRLLLLLLPSTSLQKRKIKNFLQSALQGSSALSPVDRLASTSGVDISQTNSPPISQAKIESEHRPRFSCHLCARRRLRSVASMLNLFNLKRLHWGTDTSGQQKVVLSASEVESLRSEINDLEEREAHLKARLEHIDEILRSARLSGYLQMRTRWEALPGEPPTLDESEVDDWLPRFVVLQGPCIFLYMVSTDISPQDSTLLSDVVEVGRMPSFTEEEEETRYYFYIVTRHGLRYECSSASKLQVDAWLKTLQDDCKLGMRLHDDSPDT